MIPVAREGTKRECEVWHLSVALVRHLSETWRPSGPFGVDHGIDRLQADVSPDSKPSAKR